MFYINEILPSSYINFRYQELLPYLELRPYNMVVNIAVKRNVWSTFDYPNILETLNCHIWLQDTLKMVRCLKLYNPL